MTWRQTDNYSNRPIRVANRVRTSTIVERLSLNCFFISVFFSCLLIVLNAVIGYPNSI